jgi:hypothetical protein
MGVVFRAWQRRLNQLVALKMLNGHYGPPELKRFFAEAESTGIDPPAAVKLLLPASAWGSVPLPVLGPWFLFSSTSFFVRARAGRTCGVARYSQFGEA